MSYQSKITSDTLISDSFEYFEYPEDARYNNLNYALRTVMNYIIQHYDEVQGVTKACDTLAKIIAQLES